MSVLKANNLTKVYRAQRGAVAVRALDGFGVVVETGEFVGIMGPSGSGKTTLLNLIGTIDPPSSGEIWIDGTNPLLMEGDELAQFRQRSLGLIFQEHNLLDFLTLKENILLPQALDYGSPKGSAERAVRLAERLGIHHLLNRLPYEVSGGERQLAAAARAMINEPALILADEPTGNLDSRAARLLMEALAGLNEERKLTILMATHDPVSASFCTRILFIKDGRLFTELRRGRDRRQFFRQILDVLAVMGGEGHDPLHPLP